jgi:protein SCO1
MKHLISVGLSLFVLVVSLIAASAHSLSNLENQLNSREKYFQALDKPAPGFSLQDSSGQTVTLASLRGKVVVLFFVYTNCPDVCPLHAQRIAEIQEMVNITPMRDMVRFIAISTDPKNDTPDVLRAYGTTHALDPVNWLFLTSGPQRLEATRQLVQRFGHKFTKQGDGYQVHGVVTHIIDTAGRLRANFYGLKFQPTNVVVFINALINDAHGVEK